MDRHGKGLVTQTSARAPHRHCLRQTRSVCAREPTGRANARPMTGSATKQSMLLRSPRHGLLRFARNDGRARYARSSQIVARCTMLCGLFHILPADPFQFERRMAIVTPPNRLTTQRRLLHRAGSDAHGCSNGALVRSASNSGPDRADYAHGAFAWRDRRSSHHWARTQ